MHWREIIHQSFTVALLITGTIERAETAVLEGISSLDWDDQSGQALYSRTIVASIVCGREGRNLQKFGSTPAMLPRELLSVIDLPPDIRICFVLRMLIGLSSQVCADLLRLQVRQIEERATTAVLRLSSAANGNGSGTIPTPTLFLASEGAE